MNNLMNDVNQHHVENIKSSRISDEDRAKIKNIREKWLAESKFPKDWDTFITNFQCERKLLKTSNDLQYLKKIVEDFRTAQKELKITLIKDVFIACGHVVYHACRVLGMQEKGLKHNLRQMGYSFVRKTFE